jgi:hypothetical protein
MFYIHDMNYMRTIYTRFHTRVLYGYGKVILRTNSSDQNSAVSFPVAQTSLRTIYFCHFITYFRFCVELATCIRTDSAYFKFISRNH